MKHKTLGEMTNEEIGALVRAHGEGKSVQAYWHKTDYWCHSANPRWDIGSIYRIAPEPIRQAVIPWVVFTDDVVAVAMDDDLTWYAFDSVPNHSRDYWGGKNCVSIDGIKFDRGTETDWRKTLQLRPGYEVK